MYLFACSPSYCIKKIDCLVNGVKVGWNGVNVGCGWGRGGLLGRGLEGGWRRGKRWIETGQKLGVVRVGVDVEKRGRG